MDASTKGAAASVFITVVAVCAFAVASANPPQGSGVATGSDAVLGDVTADRYLADRGGLDYPAFAFTDDDDGTGTGIYSRLTDQVSIATAGSEAMRFQVDKIYAAQPVIAFDSAAFVVGIDEDAFITGDGATAGLVTIGTTDGATDGTLETGTVVVAQGDTTGGVIWRDATSSGRRFRMEGSGNLSFVQGDNSSGTFSVGAPGFNAQVSPGSALALQMSADGSRMGWGAGNPTELIHVASDDSLRLYDGTSTNRDLTLGELTATTGVGLGDGTAAAPSLFFTSDDDGTGTGIYRQSADNLAISANGIERYRFGGSYVISANGYQADNTYAGYGTNSAGRVGYGTTNAHLTIQPDTTTNTIMVMERGDEGTDFAAPAATNPTLRIQSADEASTSDYLALSHNQDDGNLDCGAGSLNLKIAGSTKLGVQANGQTLHYQTLIQTAGTIGMRDEVGLFMGTGNDRHIQGELTVLADDTASEFVAIQSALGDAGGCVISYTCKLTDGSGVQSSRTGVVTVATVDGPSGVTYSIGDVGQSAQQTGTTTWAFDLDNTDDGDLEITCQVTTDLTPAASGIVITWSANASGDVQLNATP